MLLEKITRKIRVRVIFDKRQKHNHNSLINLDLNEKVKL